MSSESSIPRTSQNPQTEFLPADEAIPPIDGSHPFADAKLRRERRRLRECRERWNREYSENGYAYHIDRDEDGNLAMFWDDSGAPIPHTVFTDAGMRPVGEGVTLESQRRACRAATERALERAQRRDLERMMPTLRAVHGEGADIVDVATGDRATT